MIFDKLEDIQAEIRVPKNQYNDFGKFKYRSVEDIYETAKPILKKHGVVLTLTDDIVCVADKPYIKATAAVYDPEDGSHHEVVAYAGIDVNKKGMDASQVTGSASSYARKYAMNGLFLLDDNKDPDSMQPEKNPKDKITNVEAKSVRDRCGGDKDLEGFMLSAMGVKRFEDLIYERYNILIQKWDAYVQKYEAK